MGVPEALLERNEAGAYPAGEGWFVVNARDAQWFDSNGLGFYAPFEGENAGFAQLGFNVAILQPGEPSCMYHAEDAQEDFLVLSGECLLIVDGQERQLQAWDFVHCPSMAPHVFVGAGDGACVLIGTGARIPGRDLVYPVNEAALRHGAGVDQETSQGAEAYASYGRPFPAPSRPELPDL